MAAVRPRLDRILFVWKHCFRVKCSKQGRGLIRSFTRLPPGGAREPHNCFQLSFKENLKLSAPIKRAGGTLVAGYLVLNAVLLQAVYEHQSWMHVRVSVYIATSLLRLRTHCERSVAECSVATLMFIHICMQKRSSVHIASVV